MAELLLLVGGQGAGDLDHVGLGQVGGGGDDGVGHLAVIGEQQQPFAVVIEAAHRIDPLLDTVQQVHDGRAAAASLTVVTVLLGLLSAM